MNKKLATELIGITSIVYFSALFATAVAGIGAEWEIVVLQGLIIFLLIYLLMESNWRDIS